MSPPSITHTVILTDNQRIEQDDLPIKKYQNVNPLKDSHPLNRTISTNTITAQNVTGNKTDESNLSLRKIIEKRFNFQTELKWISIILITLYHALAFVLFFVAIPQAKWLSYVFGFTMGGIVGLGVTAGAHRLWSHRSYKANLPLRIILMMCFTAAGQNTIYEWVRDHRVHHKFSETDADPHNSKRGFFFAHVGWLMMKKHPEVLRRGKQLDMSDVLDDPVVQFHQRYFIPLKLMLCFIIPTLIPMVFWNESLFVSFVSQCLLRYISSLNFTWSVNSFAHIWGNRPYNEDIKPAENVSVAIFAMGEGWHNYHHAFPWDYKAAELGNYGLNLTTMWIDFFAWLGWAYDLKQPSESLVKAVAENNGDGTHPVYSELMDQIKDR